MYSSKKNVLETVALLKAKGIREIVLSPGSRNTPLIQCFASDAWFRCHSVVDERSAGFFALGIINRIQQPVAVCCTSGTALLNYGPAVAEAYYQELPLVVLSADRSEAWIGQLDGQTLPQSGIFRSLVKKSVQLPEIRSDEDRWFCNRLVNEALNAATNGPVHINIPISEPLFDFSVETLPEVRCFDLLEASGFSGLEALAEAYGRSEKTLIVIGQMQADQTAFVQGLERFRKNRSEVVLVEHLGQYQASDAIGNFDAMISTWGEAEAKGFAPDLLLTVGGHVVSKRLKKWLREHPAKQHWHIGCSDMPDTYGQATHFLRGKPEDFLNSFLPLLGKQPAEAVHPWILQWNLASRNLPEPDAKLLPFSDITVTGTFVRMLGKAQALFVGNSSPVRNLQMYARTKGLPVFCNRGTSGIEGTLSAACGYASGAEGLVYVLLGDLSFFYDLNILSLRDFPKNLRILLINNRGGAIFKLLPGTEPSEILNNYVSASHGTKAKGFIEAAGLMYLTASDEGSLSKALKALNEPLSERSVVLEVFTTDEANLQANKQYYQSLKER
jgi:2-succinyl-5-enolpyruvyl-6-hydroxy-3-cyclohexene-1-carboxylate synthase